MSGQLFADRYRIVRRLAQGGMGVVFVAEHLATERQVALKVLWPHVLGSKSAVSGFKREARLNARIESEHVVRVLDAGFDHKLSLPFLAMELLRGTTLRALVGVTGPLAPAEALAVLRQVAKALDKAHGCVDREGRPAPIVHRDLKPDNLFATLREGGDVVVKVLDFGISKALSESQPLSHEVKGTPAFMACEQFSRGPVTPQLDIWAFGLLAFYLLAGRVYWLSSTPNAPEFTPLLNEILLQPLVPPSERARAFGLTWGGPGGFDGWFLRCLEREPSARFASAGQAVEALTEVFATGAGLTEADVAAAGAGLASKVALVFERSQQEASVAEAATLPETSSLSLLKVADLLGPERPGSASTSLKTTLRDALPPPSTAPRARGLRGAVMAGIALALAGVSVVAWQGGTSSDASRPPSGAAFLLDPNAMASPSPLVSFPSPPAEPTPRSLSALAEPTPRSLSALAEPTPRSFSALAEPAPRPLSALAGPMLRALPVSAPAEEGAPVVRPSRPSLPSPTPAKPKALEKGPNAKSMSEGTLPPKHLPSSLPQSRDPRSSTWVPALPASGG
jgi:eukaryotic-like serine/threonine-protein kinase